LSVFSFLILAAILLLLGAAHAQRRKVVREFDVRVPGPTESAKTVEEETGPRGILLGGELRWEPERHPNPHVLILGGSGSGKSWTIRYLASRLLDRGYRVVLFDFHGDLAVAGARTVRIALDSEFGVNPLALSLDPTGGGPDPQRFEVLEQLRNAFKPMGSLQAALLDDCLKSVYGDFGILQEAPGSWTKPAPHLGHLAGEIERRIVAEPKDLRLRSLRTKLSLAFDFRIFSKPQVEIDSTEAAEGKGTHLDLSKLPPALQFLAADTLLKQVFRRRQLGGLRPVDCYLLIDESKICTPAKKDSPLAALNRIATEGRKFGLGLVVSSQFVGHLPRDVVVNTFTKLLMKTDKTEISATSRRFKVEEDQLLALSKPGDALVNFSDSVEWLSLRVAGESTGSDAENAGQNSC